ncbi:alpha/beta hydrolase [Nonomuraea sp. PA05]|uniref:alpha/beta fold hydrolase n=1 Tax=Nonomuraea sp. PA05 TaxID=2604466 RepID=UPI0011D50EFA|nr:alpha/beta hydrolase [Nonomuraea sp. PA05]TYB59500.1 alpha/beta hydrolase [Nonomuraea sp. PA05]
MSETFTVAAGDTTLHGTDTPGGAPALLFINGGFATQRHWRPVLRQLGGRYRTVTFDGRARGRSGRSSDYSLRGALGDVGRVIEARGLERPVLVGWSHGATLAVRYASEHPGEVSGLVLIDGAYPIATFDEAGKERVRRQFRRLGPLMRVLALLGLSARMTPAESAEVVIEMDTVNGGLAADYAALRCPAAFVVASGAHSGSTVEENARMRAAVTTATAAGERVTVRATAPGNHVQVLAKDAGLVAGVIEGIVEDAVEGSV